MNPIPLSAPDGRVYAYACARCHHVAGGSALWGHPEADGPVKELAEDSLRDATRCCTCFTCGAPTDGDGFCDGCDLDIRARHMWSAIECCMQHGFLTQEQLDDYLDSDDDE